MDIYVVAKLFGNKRVNTNVRHTHTIQRVHGSLVVYLIHGGVHQTRIPVNWL